MLMLMLLLLLATTVYPSQDIGLYSSAAAERGWYAVGEATEDWKIEKPLLFYSYPTLLLCTYENVAVVKYQLLLLDGERN